MRPGYRRFIVEVVASSRGYYEVEALNSEHARKMPLSEVRAAKVVVFTEKVTVTNVMEVKD